MNRSEAMKLMRSLEARFPAFSEASEDRLQAFIDDLADIPVELASPAARSLLYETPDRLPNGPAIRRRAIEDAGLLAPSWSEAQRLHSEVAAGRLGWRDLPGPVQVLDEDDWHATFMRPVEEKYSAAAQSHDRRVLAPGGIAELVGAAEWLAAARRHTDLVVLARQCQATLGEPIRLEMSDGEAEQAVAEFRRRTGETPELVASTNPDERWEPAPKVLDVLAGIRNRVSSNGRAS